MAFVRPCTLEIKPCIYETKVQLHAAYLSIIIDVALYG